MSDLTNDPYKELFDALQYLIEVKQHKDKYGKDEWYEDHRELAWELATKAIERAKESNHE